MAASGCRILPLLWQTACALGYHEHRLHELHAVVEARCTNQDIHCGYLQPERHPPLWFPCAPALLNMPPPQLDGLVVARPLVDPPTKDVREIAQFTSPTLDHACKHGFTHKPCNLPIQGPALAATELGLDIFQHVEEALCQVVAVQSTLPCRIQPMERAPTLPRRPVCWLLQ